ncbi:MAG: sulfatase [Verrucomicrobiaceae bacterium]|nr:sulfatase [Verrucomicrobiaceae bacterium]
MNIRHLSFSALVIALGLATTLGASVEESPRPPNVVVILCDNLGNGDIACFNPATKHRTPNLDRMAAEGRKFTSFYSASGVCTPSRAALMTGCYPRRVGLHISAIGAAVLQPVAQRGLNPHEETIAELLKERGYATACIGKWHLGDQQTFLPTRHGFDTFFGIPYSEDMVHDKFPDRNWPPLPLLRDEKVMEAPVEAETLTERCTKEAVTFIKRHRSNPFFLYFPAPGPGSRAVCYPGKAFRGKSANGLYGDSIEELDWSAGEVLKAIRDAGVDSQTLVIWTNDNGAVNRNPAQGSNAPYKGMGYSTSEGGMRMPCIVRWPGRIPANTECKELCTMMDILPTVAHLTGARLPKLPIDGKDISNVILSTDAKGSPHDETGFFYYQVEQLQAVRAGKWKLYLPIENKRGLGGKVKAKDSSQKLALYDVVNDPKELSEVSASNEAVVNRLLALAADARTRLGDGPTTGTGQRPAGWVDPAAPLIKN